MKISTAFSVQLSATAALAVLQVVSLAMLARRIPPEEFGYAASASVALLVGLAVSDGGFGAALIRKRTLNERFFGTVVSLSLLVSVPINALVYGCLALFWADQKMYHLIAVFSVAAEAHVVAGVFKSSIQRNLRYLTLLKINGVSYFFGMIVLAVALADAGHGAYAIAYGQLGYGVLSVIIAYRNVVFRYAPVVTRRYVRPIFGFGMFVTANRIIDVFLFEMEKLFLGKYAGFEKVGVYERVSRIGLLAGGHGAFIIDSVLYPLICRDIKDGSSESVGDKVLFVIVLAGTIFIAGSGFTEYLIGLLLGAGYMPETGLLGVVLVAAYLRVISRPFEVMTRAEGRPQASAFLKIPPTAVLAVALVLLSDMSLITWAGAFAGAQAAVLLLQFGATLNGRTHIRTLSLMVFIHAPITVGLMMFVTFWPWYPALEERYPPYMISVALAAAYGVTCLVAGRRRARAK